MRYKEITSFIGTMLLAAFIAAWPIGLYGHIIVPDDYGDTNPRGDMACGIAIWTADLLVGFLYARLRHRRLQKLLA